MANLFDNLAFGWFNSDSAEFDCLVGINSIFGYHRQKSMFHPCGLSRFGVKHILPMVDLERSDIFPLSVADAPAMPDPVTRLVATNKLLPGHVMKSTDNDESNVLPPLTANYFESDSLTGSATFRTAQRC